MSKRRLSDIAISHISLVKAGANGKTIIYKSKEASPTYNKEIKVAKYDEEKGIVYGIVYAPDEEDSQGDSATASEIEKAAYAFMKERNTLNVDKNHDFKNVDAYVCESYIVRKGDELFPENEKAWAVGIKIENEELKTLVKKGELAGLSMAGSAKVEEIAEDGNITKSVTEAIKNAINTIKKSLETKSTIKKEEIETLIQKEIEPILKENTALKKEAEESKSKLETLTKERDELIAELTKSKQNHQPSKVAEEATEIAKKAKEYIHEEAKKGNKISAAEAVAFITKGDKK